MWTIIKYLIIINNINLMASSRVTYEPIWQTVADRAGCLWHDARIRGDHRRANGC